jgi:hypothetical protein
VVAGAQLPALGGHSSGICSTVRRQLATAPSSGNAPSSAPFDVALLLKIVPCLTQLDKAIGARLLDAVTARVLIVSFPAQSLGGRRKGMVATYAAQMEALLAGRAWPVERFEFPKRVGVSAMQMTPHPKGPSSVQFSSSALNPARPPHPTPGATSQSSITHRFAL